MRHDGGVDEHLIVWWRSPGSSSPPHTVSWIQVQGTAHGSVSVATELLLDPAGVADVVTDDCWHATGLREPLTVVPAHDAWTVLTALQRLQIRGADVQTLDLVDAYGIDVLAGVAVSDTRTLVVIEETLSRRIADRMYEWAEHQLDLLPTIPLSSRNAAGWVPLASHGWQILARTPDP